MLQEKLDSGVSLTGDGCMVFGVEVCSKNCKPSIEYLELFALCAGVLAWCDTPRLNNTRIIIFCDNQAVVSMVNNTTSGCKNCMVLLRTLVLNNLKHNRRIFVSYVRSSANILADSLSRGKFDTFWKHAPNNTRTSPDVLPQCLTNIERMWIH